MYAEWLHGSAKATDEFLGLGDFAKRYFFKSIFFERTLK